MTKGPFNNTVDAETAEQLGALSADLLRKLLAAGHEHPDWEWPLLVDAAFLALRGIEAMAARSETELTREQIKQLIVMRCVAVFGLPDEVMRVVDDGKDDGPAQVGILPVRKH
jgi:hypothetical protein